MNEYNAKVEVVTENESARIFRIYPSSPKLNYFPGQYGSLGLYPPNNHQKLIKRAYSFSSSIIDLKTSKLINHADTNYYEVYVNKYEFSESNRERLVPYLFNLKTGDSIFCGKKVVGYYTLNGVDKDKNILLIGTKTGEAPNNAIVNQLLIENRKIRICNVVIDVYKWQSLYYINQKELLSKFPNYKFLLLQNMPYDNFAEVIKTCFNDEDYSKNFFGFSLDKNCTQIYLCGDPQMIGAPLKLGAWNYQLQEYGLIKILTQFGFEINSKFNKGNIEYECYW